MKAKLSSYAQKLIDEFGRTAGEAYWQQDQGGFDAEIKQATDDYIEAKARLEKYILALQIKANK